MNDQSLNTKHQPLRIAVDGNEANVTNRVGSNEYAFQILQALERLTLKEKIECTILLTSYQVDDMPMERNGWKYEVISPRKFATQFALPLYLFTHKLSFDVFFTPGHYAPRFCPIPYVSSVMDLAFYQFSEQFRSLDLYQLKNWTRYSAKNAAHVIAISEATKKDIQHYYKIPADNISVAYPAVDQKLLNIEISKRKEKEILTRFRIRKPFILYVGTIQPRKNIVRMIEGFELYIDRLKKAKVPAAKLPQLVIAGKVGWLSGEVVRKIERSKYKDAIVTTGFVSEKEKVTLYKHAECSVLIGLYEGFGMPPLESLAFGTIPVVSNTTSLPEVVGEAGVLVDPLDVQSIAEGFEKACNMTRPELHRFQQLAREQLKKFSWEKSAKVILDVLKTIS